MEASPACCPPECVPRQSGLKAATWCQGALLSKFMEKLGVAPVGFGRIRLRNQMRRFLNAGVRSAYRDAEGEASMGGVLPPGLSYGEAQSGPTNRLLGYK